MADKTTTRPTGLIPSWSNDANLNDPGQPWDATATKVEPGAGKRDDGFLPEENPEAQHVNHLLNEQGTWIQFFSDMQAQNWSVPVEPRHAGAIQSADALCYDRGAEQYAIVGENVAGSAAIGFTADGYWFFEQGIASAGYNLTWCAAKIPSDAPVTTGRFFIVGGGGRIITDTIGAVVNQRNTPGAGDVVDDGVWDGGNASFATGGNDGAGNAQLWTSPAAAMAWTLGAGIGAPVNSVTVTCMAASDDPASPLVVAFGDNQTPDSWTSTDGGVNWTLRVPAIVGTAGTDVPRSIAYSAALGVWMLLLKTEVWTSPDGIVWSLVASGLTVDFQYRCLATSGSMWIAADATDAVIYYSTDLGVTWRKFWMNDDDRALGVADKPVTGIIYSEYRREFALVKAFTGGTGQFRRSMSIGTTLLTSEGESVPTVT